MFLFHDLVTLHEPYYSPPPVCTACPHFHFTLSFSSLPTPNSTHYQGSSPSVLWVSSFSPVHPHPHPPFQQPLPTPVINFSTEPLSFFFFFLVSSLLFLHFPLLLFFSPPSSILSFLLNLVTKKRGSVPLSLLTAVSQKRGTGHAAVQQDGTVRELTQNSQFRRFVVPDISDNNRNPSLRR